MWAGSRLEHAVLAGAVGVLFAAVAAGTVRSPHVVSLFATYVLATVVAIVLVDVGRSPGLADAVWLAAAVALLVAAPVAFGLGLPPATVDNRSLHVARFAAQWALPIALTVPLGVLRSNAQRAVLLLAHPVALALLLWLAEDLYGAPQGPTWGLTSLTTVQYLVGVVVAAPAALLLARRRRVASVIPK